ncbi:transposase domain-containing protein, partial [Roseomonas sp. GCM10028921]
TTQTLDSSSETSTPTKCPIAVTSSPGPDHPTPWAMRVAQDHSRSPPPWNGPIRYLFASGDDGGARWAAVASLVETCKLNGVDPQRYLTDLLTRLVEGWPNSRIDELMPWCWAAAEAG